MRWIAALAAALILSGCAEPAYVWTKAGPHSYEQDSGACKADITRRIKETPPNYILKDGASYSASGEWSQRTFNECMRAAGYTASREMNSPEVKESKALPKPAAPAAVPSAPPSTVSMNMAGRLRELRGLLDQGLITQIEYDQRRKVMLDSM